MEPKDGLYFLRAAKERGISANIIMMSGKADVDMALDAIGMGACDYLDKPFTARQLFFVLKRAEAQTKLRRENAQLRVEVQDKYSFHNIVAKSPQMERIFDIIQKVADYKTTVLVTGESGTGKELVAKAIHFNSIRRKAPFVAINCGGIPENLLESELFGHVKGAFTDAVRTKKGLFEEADGGTLFLDELGDLPLQLQVKLLRVLQEEEIRPLGDTRSIKVDVRIVAATAKDLAKEAMRGKFREDLFYRINVLSIILPPLRNRKEDIPILVEHFLQKYNRRLKMDVQGLSHETMNVFLQYQWPGNVRELENVIERALVLADGPIINVDELPPQMMVGTELAGIAAVPGLDDSILSIKKSSKILEKELIQRALAKTKGNKTQAAHILEISLPALLYKMKDYGLAPNKAGQANGIL
jgi:two-component system response regulator AtoC